MRNPYESPTQVEARKGAVPPVVFIIFGFVGLGLGVAGVYIACVPADALLRDLGIPSEHWGAINAEHRNMALMIAAPLLLGALSFLAAAWMKR